MNRTARSLLHMIRVRPRLFIVAAIGIAIGLLLPEAIAPHPLSRWLIAWNCGAWLYIVLAAAMMIRSSEHHMRHRAQLRRTRGIVFKTERDRRLGPQNQLGALKDRLTRIADVVLENRGGLRRLPFDRNPIGVGMVDVRTFRLIGIDFELRETAGGQDHLTRVVLSQRVCIRARFCADHRRLNAGRDRLQRGAGRGGQGGASERGRGQGGQCALHGGVFSPERDDETPGSCVRGG